MPLKKRKAISPVRDRSFHPKLRKPKMKESKELTDVMKEFKENKPKKWKIKY